MTFSANDAYQLCYWLDTPATPPPSSPPPGWTFVFTPTFGGQNYAVVLRNNSDSNQLAIVIWGTHDWSQIKEDFKIDKPVDFAINGNPIIAGAQIAKGANDAFQNVLELSQNGQTLFNFLTTITWTNLSINSMNPSVLITGHSLGGTVASIMAPWLATFILRETSLQPPLPSNLQVITFAAFAAGNSQFASYLDQSPQYQANINLNDVVPQVWATSGPYQVNNIYGMFASPGPAMPKKYQRDLKAKMSAFENHNSGFQYVQTSNPNTFSGTIQTPPSFSACKNPQDCQWLWEVNVQHNYAYCVQFIQQGCTLPGDDCPESE
jgi:hypothetical protein